MITTHQIRAVQARDVVRQIGERLRMERKREHMTQPILATAIGATLSAVQLWEAGKSMPKAHHLAAMTPQGLDVLFILTGERTPKPNISLPANAPLASVFDAASALLKRERHLLLKMLLDKVLAE